MGASRSTSLAFLSRATFLHTSMILISMSHCEITGLTKRSHEADIRSTACFHECDAWLCSVLSHSTYEHVFRLDLPRSMGTSLRKNTCVVLRSILAASVRRSGVRKARGTFYLTRNVKLYCLIRVTHCSSVTVRCFPCHVCLVTFSLLDILVHAILHTFSSHHHRFAK